MSAVEKHVGKIGVACRQAEHISRVKAIAKTNRWDLRKANSGFRLFSSTTHGCCLLQFHIYIYIHHIIPPSFWIKMHWIYVVLIAFHDWYTEDIRWSWLSTGGKKFSLAGSFFANTANGCCCCCHFRLFLCQDVPPAYQWPSVCYHMFPLEDPFPISHSTDIQFWVEVTQSLRRRRYIHIYHILE